MLSGIAQGWFGPFRNVRPPHPFGLPVMSLAGAATTGALSIFLVGPALVKILHARARLKNEADRGVDPRLSLILTVLSIVLLVMSAYAESR